MADSVTVPWTCFEEVQMIRQIAGPIAVV